MHLSLSWLNGFLLLLPLLAWNAVFTPRLKHPGFASDEGVPAWLLWTEHALRLPVFGLPIFMPLVLSGLGYKLGVWLFGIGSAIYLFSWLPLMYRPQSAYSRSLIGFLAPHLTPLIWLLGLAFLTGSWGYAVLSIGFVFIHSLHAAIRYRFIQR